MEAFNVCLKIPVEAIDQRAALAAGLLMFEEIATLFSEQVVGEDSIFRIDPVQSSEAPNSVSVEFRE